MTDKPRDYALGIAAAGVVCAALFMHCCMWFEFFDRDRIKRVNARLCAYVADLEAMQRRLEEGSAREAEAKARALAEEASSRQKDSFVAMVSHEIRTPLNAISGAAALLAATSLDTEQRELVTLLETGTAHVVLIVEDILIAGVRARVMDIAPCVRVLTQARYPFCLRRPWPAALSLWRASGCS
jgi:signal transduction histidine kinase